MAGSYFLLSVLNSLILEILGGGFPGGPVVETSPSNSGSASEISGQGSKIPHSSGPKTQKRKAEAIL